MALGDRTTVIGECGCCGCPDPVLQDCTSWPFASVEFTLDSLTMVAASEEGGEAASCCALEFLPGFWYFPDLAACLNQTWPAPLTSTGTSSSLNGEGQTICIAGSTYAFRCEDVILEPPAGFFFDFLLDVHVFVSFAVARNMTTNAQTVTVFVSFIYAILATTGGFGYGSAVTDGCGASVGWQHTFEDDEFDCAGPWDLELSGVGSSSQITGWPAVLTLSTPGGAEASCCPDVEGEECVARSWDCDEGTHVCTEHEDETGEYPTLAECLEACETTPSYNCDEETFICTDPGDGTGTYTGVTAYENCLDFCLPNPPVTYNCVDGVCVDPGNGTGTYTGASALTDCQEVCVDTGPVDTVCCPFPPGAPRILYFIMTATGCDCLPAIGNLIWNDGNSRWEHSGFACGQFTALYVYCGEGGIYYTDFWCNGDAFWIGVPLAPLSACDPVHLEISGGTTLAADTTCCPSGTVINLDVAENPP